MPEAIVNYLVLLGWSPGKNREIISLEEVEKIFDIKDVNKTASIFSIDKLAWINSQYIRRKSGSELKTLIKDYLQKKEFLKEPIDDGYLEEVVNLFKNRISKLSELMEWGYFCFYDDYEYDQNSLGVLEKDLSEEMKVLVERLSLIEDFNEENVEKEFRQTAVDLNLKTRDLVHPTRVALTGRKVGPGLFETMKVLGKEKVLNRLQRLINYWQKKEK